jgi:hypothetical protein
VSETIVLGPGPSCLWQHCGIKAKKERLLLGQRGCSWSNGIVLSLGPLCSRQHHCIKAGELLLRRWCCFELGATMHEAAPLYQGQRRGVVVESERLYLQVSKVTGKF